jgi:tripeptidyl-peptidase-1
MRCPSEEPLTPFFFGPVLTSSQSSNEPYIDLLTYLLKLPDHELPQTLSTSYGEDEQSVPRAYAQKICQLFGQLGARGVSVLFSSGE